VEAVRLINGKECLAVDKSDIATLIEALCDGPLDGQAELPEAFRHAAAKAFSEADRADAGQETVADAARWTAALAVLLSGSDQDAARRTLAELAMRSSAVRLDAMSAAAFVGAVEQMAEPAPAHLVEQLLAVESTAVRGRHAAPDFWSHITDRIRPARGWRVAGACLLVLLASAASWSLYWREPNQLASPVPPEATKAKAPVPVVDVPTIPQRSLVAAPTEAAASTCSRPGQVVATVQEASRSQDRTENARTNAPADCSPMPGHQFATDAAGKDVLQNAEQAVPAAAAASVAVEPSAKMDARRMREPAQADQLGSILGPTDRPAAALPEPSRPAAPPPASVLSR
jgi:hypothetical protein